MRVMSLGSTAAVGATVTLIGSSGGKDGEAIGAVAKPLWAWASSPMGLASRRICLDPWLALTHLLTPAHYRLA